jgi:hypothetical protein
MTMAVTKDSEATIVPFIRIPPVAHLPGLSAWKAKMFLDGLFRQWAWARFSGFVISKNR